jgi:hypothetical protein
VAIENRVTLSFDMWEEFREEGIPGLFGPEGVFKRGLYLFRGMASSDWKLISSLDRQFSHIPVEGRNGFADRLLTAFIEECQSLSRALDWTDRNIKLALAQHFGLPTRLLDWSLSPYIAAYFAFADLAHKRQDEVEDIESVAIWALDTRAKGWTGDVGVEILTVPPVASAMAGSENPRMLHQVGRFTLMKSTFASLEEYVRTLTSTTPVLTQFTIPPEEARKALADLDSMGIRATHLFPDLTGAATTALTRVTLLE